MVLRPKRTRARIKEEGEVKGNRRQLREVTVDGGPGEGQNRRRQVRKLEGKEIGTSRGN